MADVKPPNEDIKGWTCGHSFGPLGNGPMPMAGPNEGWKGGDPDGSEPYAMEANTVNPPNSATGPLAEAGWTGDRQAPVPDRLPKGPIPSGEMGTTEGGMGTMPLPRALQK